VKGVQPPPQPSPQGGGSQREIFITRRRELGLAVLIVAIFACVGLVDPRFLSWEIVLDLLVRAAPTVIVACGVMLVVVTSEIDISVGSLMALLAALMGQMISRNEADWPMYIGIPITLVIGSLVGLATGALVTLGKVPSIIVTLGLLTALRGITTLIMRGENIDGLPDSLSQWAKQGWWGVPLSVWAATATVAATGTIISFTPLGKRLFALGSSSYSARMVGLPERRLKLFVFAYTGFLTALATIVEVPRLPKIEAGIGSEFELLVVTCVVVGGVSISGGRGTLTGVVLAVLFMTMVRPVLTFLDVGEAGEKWTKAIQGLFIVLAIMSDTVLSRRRPGAGP
jgi:ribose/xylose/arabinose/galactoside ABC-type transport system permease subunit